MQALSAEQVCDPLEWIPSQKPDAQKIGASSSRVPIDQHGVVRDSELCYCSTPLAHERATGNDRHFTDTSPTLPLKSPPVMLNATANR